MGCNPGLGLGEGAVIDRDVMPLLREMPRHRKTHYAQAQKCYFRHVEYSDEWVEYG